MTRQVKGYVSNEGLNMDMSRMFQPIERGTFCKPVRQTVSGYCVVRGDLNRLEVGQQTGLALIGPWVRLLALSCHVAKQNVTRRGRAWAPISVMSMTQCHWKLET